MTLFKKCYSVKYRVYLWNCRCCVIVCVVTAVFLHIYICYNFFSLVYIFSGFPFLYFLFNFFLRVVLSYIYLCVSLVKSSFFPLYTEWLFSLKVIVNLWLRRWFLHGDIRWAEGGREKEGLLHFIGRITSIFPSRHFLIVWFRLPAPVKKWNLSQNK